MANFQLFHDFILTNGSAKSSGTAMGSSFSWGVKFHEWSTSAKFAEFTYLEKNQLYSIAFRGLCPPDPSFKDPLLGLTPSLKKS